MMIDQDRMVRPASSKEPHCSNMEFMHRHLAKNKSALPGVGMSLLAAILLSLLPLLSSTASSQSVPTKKLIEWGWDEPDTTFIQQHIAEMETFPFDGLVFHANSSK